VAQFIKDYFEVCSDSRIKKEMGTDELLYTVNEKGMEGFGIFDVRVIDSEKHRFDEMGAFFYNRMISYDQLGEYTQNQIDWVSIDTAYDMLVAVKVRCL
jgi:hypothetical protein